MKTVFEKIRDREIPKEFLYEDDEIMAFYDVAPIAPVHVLIVPKKVIVSIATLADEDVPMVGRMFRVARDVARDLQIAESGYKLLFRVGEHGGQEVPHLHLHLIGGARLTENIRPV
ncbi:MAG: histidine triad nucleotide-binding protein [Candidatus Moraniibacteriota bacterium]|nr:MAG: histidine triad nucleotide-binding protein [Candidatus Moranbacteria bacterium]